VQSATRGDPEAALLWVSRSQRHLAGAFVEHGFTASQKLVGRLLRTLGFSLQASRNTLEGASHPDRDAQFEHINTKIKAFQATGQPTISVDTKKERAKEEKRRIVRWLRPEYQIPRFGSEKGKVKQLEADLGGSAEPQKAGAKPTFPTADGEQTAVVLNMLVEGGGSLNAADNAARFKQGQKVRPAAASVLLSLCRIALISTADGGRTFAYRHAA
jgi:hypothetical protein